MLSRRGVRPRCCCWGRSPVNGSAGFVLGCAIATIDTFDDQAAFSSNGLVQRSWLEHRITICGLLVAAFSLSTPQKIDRSGPPRRSKTSPRVLCFGRGRYNRMYVLLQHAAVGTVTGSWVGCGSVDG